MGGTLVLSRGIAWFVAIIFWACANPTPGLRRVSRSEMIFFYWAHKRCPTSGFLVVPAAWGRPIRPACSGPIAWVDCGMSRRLVAHFALVAPSKSMQAFGHAPAWLLGCVMPGLVSCRTELVRPARRLGRTPAQAQLSRPRRSAGELPHRGAALGVPDLGPLGQHDGLG